MPRCRPWTFRERQLLRERYGMEPTEELARKLNRTAKAVRSQAQYRRIGFYGERDHPLRHFCRFTPREDQRILALHAQGLWISAIARKLHRGDTGVRRRGILLGIRWQKCSRGERNSQCKLTAAQVSLIRRQWLDFPPNLKRSRARLLAQQHGVTVKTIYKVVHRELWSHVA